MQNNRVNKCTECRECVPLHYHGDRTLVSLNRRELRAQMAAENTGQLRAKRAQRTDESTKDRCEHSGQLRVQRSGVSTVGS